MMSAWLRPVWGRAAGMFSTFTARAGRFGTVAVGALPVSGHSGGGVCEPPCPTWSSARGPTPAFPPTNSTTATAPPTTSNAVRIAIRPRRDDAMGGRRLLRGFENESRRMLDAEGGPYNDPGPPSHIVITSPP